MTKRIPVYLAGGMKPTPVRRELIRLLRGANFSVIDPARQPPGLGEHAYTKWDLAGVRRARAVVALMEPSNPSGYGMSVEVGYAHALAKPVIFLNTLPKDDWRHRYFGMVRAIADSARDPADAVYLLLLRTSP